MAAIEFATPGVGPNEIRAATGVIEALPDIRIISQADAALTSPIRPTIIHVGAGIVPSKIPNPYGRLGGPAHQATVAERAAELIGQGYRIEGGGGILPEKALQTVAGRRFPDITAADPLGRPYYENIGRITGAGIPVARELRALDEIERATGIRPTFTPYNR